MNENESYGVVAKMLHWVVAATLGGQFLLGWLMPNVRRGMQPGQSMHLHISIGVVVLALIVVRLSWRLMHPVPPEPELPRWQLRASRAVHGSLYLLLLVSTLTGWFYASMRGWPLTFFGLFPLPPLVPEGSRIGRAIGGIHETIVWVLLGVIAVHVLAALVHAFIYRDRVMQRMLFVERSDATR